MTDSPHNPGHNPETDNASAQALDNQKAFAEVLQLTHSHLLNLNHTDKPAAASVAEKPAGAEPAKAEPHPHPLQVADNRSGGEALKDGAVHNLGNSLLGIASMAGARGRTNEQIQDDIKHHAGTQAAPNIYAGLFSSAKNLIVNSPEIAKGAVQSIAGAWGTARHGTFNEKMELAGAGLATAGTLLVGGAGTLGKVGTEARAATLGNEGLAAANASRGIMGEYAQGTRTASQAALRVAEEKATVAAGERALARTPHPIEPMPHPAGNVPHPIETVPHPIEAVPHPTAALSGRAAELPLPKIESNIAGSRPPILSRLTENFSSPFRSLLKSTEHGVVDRPLAARVDGLNVEAAGAHPANIHLGDRFSPSTRIAPEPGPVIGRNSLKHPIKVEPLAPAPARIGDAPRPATPHVAEPVARGVEPVKPAPEVSSVHSRPAADPAPAHDFRPADHPVAHPVDVDRHLPVAERTLVQMPHEPAAARPAQINRPAEAAPVEVRKPAPVERDVPAPAQARHIDPVEHDVPPPAQARHIAPAEHDVPAPAQARHISPVEHDVPAPAQARHIAPAEHDVPAPAQARHIAPAEHDVPAPAQARQSVPGERDVTPPQQQASVVARHTDPVIAPQSAPKSGPARLDGHVEDVHAPAPTVARREVHVDEPHLSEPQAPAPAAVYRDVQVEPLTPASPAPVHREFNVEPAPAAPVHHDVNVEPAPPAAVHHDVNVEPAPAAPVHHDVNVEPAPPAAAPVSERLSQSVAPLAKDALGVEAIESQTALETGANKSVSSVDHPIDAPHDQSRNLERAPQADIAATNAPLPTPKVLAEQAHSELEGFTRLIAQRESFAPALQQELQQNLRAIGDQLQAVTRSPDVALSTVARESLAKNLSAVERVVTEGGADATLTREFSQFKTSVEKLTAPESFAAKESGVARIERPEIVSTDGPVGPTRPVTANPSEPVAVVEPVAAPSQAVKSPDVVEPVAAPSQAVRSADIVEPAAAPSQAVKSADVVEPAAAPSQPVRSADVVEPVAAPSQAVKTADVVEPVAAPSQAVRSADVVEPVAAPSQAVRSADVVEPVAAPSQAVRPADVVEPVAAPSQAVRPADVVEPLAPQPVVRPADVVTPVEVPSDLAAVRAADVAPESAPLAAPAAPSGAVNLTPSLPLSNPAVAAERAAAELQSFSRLTGEGGTTLSAEAERSLQNLGRHFEDIARSTDAVVPAATRSEMAADLATIQKSMAGAATDSGALQQLDRLKASINEIAPTASIIPVTEAPAALAARTTGDIDNLTRYSVENAIKIAPEAELAVKNIGTQLDVVSSGGAQTLTAQAGREVSQQLAVVERSLTEAGADAGTMQRFNEVKTSVGDLTRASVERQQIANVSESMTALESHGADFATNLRDLNRELRETAGLSVADQKVAQSLSTKVEAVEQKLAEGSLSSAPVATSTDIQQVVRELQKPEYSAFFAENPRAAQVLREVQDNAAAISGASARVESAQIGLNGLKDAQVFEKGVDNLAALSTDLRATLPAAEATSPVANALESIDRNLATIKTGANPEAVLRQVHADIDAIEAGGATKIADQLKENLGPLENASTALDRGQRLERTITTIDRQGTALESQTAKLSEQFSQDARTAASTTASAPVNAQISDQLQLISRQAKLLDAGEGGVAAITKIKDAYTRVEELTAGETLAPAQSNALRQIKESIREIDQASVDATGLRRFENNAVQINEQSARVETLTGRISNNIDLTAPVAQDANLGQKLTDINQAAREVKTATTLEGQVNAVNKLANAVQEPELQAALGRSQNGLRALDELKTTTAQLHESVSFRALERSQVAAEAEAQNSARAASALEQRIAGDVSLSSAPNVQAAVTDYRNAAESFAKAPDKNLAAAQLDQKFANVETQIRTVAPTSPVLGGEEMTALRRSQTGLSQSAADSELIGRSLIERRLPVVENGFEQIGRATSTAVQRDLMRGVSDQIQSMRYLEARTGAGADQLTDAQMQLARAQNNLEVAAYRGNLVKLAAGGDQAATDKLLISGLTSDGYKATSVANTTGPAARLIEDFSHNRLALLGRDQASFSIRSLAASDPIFTNNPGWLSANAIRNTGYTLLGVGGVTFGVGAVRDAMDNAGKAVKNDVTATTEAAQTPQSAQILNGQAAVNVGADNSFNPPSNPVADAAADTLSVLPTATTAAPASLSPSPSPAPSPNSPVGDNRVVGRVNAEPNGLSVAGQNLARQAYALDLNQQALPRLNTLSNEANSIFGNPVALNDAAAAAYASTYSTTDSANSNNLANPANPFSVANLHRSAVPQSGPFMLYRDDPDLDMKLFNISISGTLFGVKKGSDATAPSDIRTPLTMAQSLQLRPTAIRSTDGARLDKLATSMFAIPSTQLSSPMALGFGQRRDVLTSRSGGPIFGGAAGVASRSGDSSSAHAANLMSADASAEEGGVNAGTRHLKDVESAEASRLDSSAVHSGGAPVANHNNDDDDDEHGQSGPGTVAATSPSGSPTGPTNVGGSGNASGTARRIPVTAQARDGVADTAATPLSAQPSEAKPISNVGAPPRKRSNADAISA